MKVIFLDMDGVLNNHVFNKNSLCCTVSPDNVEKLNKILVHTDAKIVLSSAWRYIVAAADMTLRGFEYMLRTHGVLANVSVIGITDSDEKCYNCGSVIVCSKQCAKCEECTTRGDQIANYLKAMIERPEAYVVVDDLDLGISGRHPFVKTDSDYGLTESDAEQIIKMLNASC